MIDVSEENSAYVFRTVVQLNHIDGKISCYRGVFEFTEPSKIEVHFNQCYCALANNLSLDRFVATDLQSSTGLTRSWKYVCNIAILPALSPVAAFAKKKKK